MELIREEMGQFYDVVSAKEFRQIEQKYPTSRVALMKVIEKVDEFDK